MCVGVQGVVCSPQPASTAVWLAGWLAGSGHVGRLLVVPAAWLAAYLLAGRQGDMKRQTAVSYVRLSRGSDP